MQENDKELLQHRIEERKLYQKSPFTSGYKFLFSISFLTIVITSLFHYRNELPYEFYTFGDWIREEWLKYSVFFWIIITVIASLVVLPILMKVINTISIRNRLKSVQAIKLDEKMKSRTLFGTKPHNHQLYSKIIQYTATQLLEKIRSKELTSEEIVRAFIYRSIQCDKNFNLLNDDAFLEAVSKAKELDSYYESTGTLKGPLHGLPISLKDCFDLIGTDSTIGNLSLCNKPAEEDSVITKLIKEAGGIPFTKTNDMQCLFGTETSNPVWGRSLNPWNTKRSTGGSTGGEAALVCSYGSPLGIGTDIGGSIRIPSHCCGIYGIKYTGKRMTGIGQIGYGAGQEAIRDSCGPMARSVDDLVLMSRIFLNERMHDLDSSIAPMNFRDEKFFSKQKPTFGYYTFDGFQEASASCRRAVEQTVQSLRDSNYEVIEIKVPRPQDFPRYFWYLICADGFKTLRTTISNDPVDSIISSFTVICALPRFIVSLLVIIFGFLKESRPQLFLSSSMMKELPEILQIQRERKEYQNEFFEMIRKNRIDAIICPSNATIAFPHRSTETLGFGNCSYTWLYNLLDCPAGVVPVTKVTKNDLSIPRTKVDYVDTLLTKAEKESEGLPVSVQVVSLPYHDETVLKCMKIVSDLNPFEPLPYDNQ